MMRLEVINYIKVSTQTLENYLKDKGIEIPIDYKESGMYRAALEFFQEKGLVDENCEKVTIVSNYERKHLSDDFEGDQFLLATSQGKYMNEKDGDALYKMIYFEKISAPKGIDPLYLNKRRFHTDINLERWIEIQLTPREPIFRGRSMCN